MGNRAEVVALLALRDYDEDVDHSAGNWWLNYGRVSLINVSKCRSSLSCLAEYFAACVRTTRDTWGNTGSVNVERETHALV